MNHDKTQIMKIFCVRNISIFVRSLRNLVKLMQLLHATSNHFNLLYLRQNVAVEGAKVNHAYSILVCPLMTNSCQT